MPKGPQGQKRPADAVARAVMVAQIATGEIEDDGYAHPKGSAGGLARAASLSAKDRKRVAKAGAEARWKERRVTMTNQEQLMAALFDNPHREHVDIKFFIAGGMDLTAEMLCGDAVSMLKQMDNNVGDSEFAESFSQREVSDFIATI